MCYREECICFENENVKGEKEKMIGSSSVYVLYVIRGRCYCKVDSELFGKTILGYPRHSTYLS